MFTFLAISDGTFTKEASSLPQPLPQLPSSPSIKIATIDDPHNPLYEVDTLIDSLDYERLYLTDDQDIDNVKIPSSTNQMEFIRQRRKLSLVNRDEQLSPQKRRLASINENNEQNITNQEYSEEISTKQQTVNQTLGERLQKAVDLYKEHGQLPFDDDYIELVRQLFNNSSLTHLEQLHLKSLFLDN